MKALTGTAISGRYRIFFAGHECGEERWRIEATDDGGAVVTGEQVIELPHPFPNRQEYRVVVDEAWRPTALDLRWTVGDRVVVSTHRAESARWRVRIETGGAVREQEGDFPEFAEVEIPSMISNVFLLARRDFAEGGEHEFPVLRIGPPLMAVSPERMLVRCVEKGTFDTPLGPVRASRYVVSLPPRGEDEGYAFWADDDGFVLESYEGLDRSRPWMRLVELTKGA
jgi:hypothetical protein